MSAKPMTLRSLRSSAAADALSSTSRLREPSSRVRASLAPSENKVRRFKKSGLEEDSTKDGKAETASSWRNFGAAPKKTLNIDDVSVKKPSSVGVKKSWTQRAEEAIKNEGSNSKLPTLSQIANQIL